jgi:hypothetical protein
MATLMLPIRLSIGKEIIMTSTPEVTSNIDRAIEQCLQCVRWCSACVTAGLLSDPANMAASVRLCHECAPICGNCATLLSGDSQFAHQLCGVCADICDACASECQKHKHNDTMRRCAEVCLLCAQTCREIANSGPIRKAA